MPMSTESLILSQAISQIVIAPTGVLLAFTWVKYDYSTKVP